MHWKHFSFHEMHPLEKSDKKCQQCLTGPRYFCHVFDAFENCDDDFWIRNKCTDASLTTQHSL